MGCPHPGSAELKQGAKYWTLPVVLAENNHLGVGAWVKEEGGRCFSVTGEGFVDWGNDVGMKGQDFWRFWRVEARWGFSAGHSAERRWAISPGTPPQPGNLQAPLSSVQCRRSQQERYLPDSILA